ncbi:MAG TPA: tetratricopeptide repeat protein [Gemmataceae bacterium]|nr:tetratricopeptide repeat protein [Gemmataceae bacterium]
MRLFRNHPHIRWQYRVYEQVLGALGRLDTAFRKTDIIIGDSGYHNPAVLRRKPERNLQVLHLENRDHPDHPFTLFNLGWAYREQRRSKEALAYLHHSLGRWVFVSCDCGRAVPGPPARSVPSDIRLSSITRARCVRAALDAPDSRRQTRLRPAAGPNLLAPIKTYPGSGKDRSLGKKMRIGSLPKHGRIYHASHGHGHWRPALVVAESGSAGPPAAWWPGGQVTRSARRNNLRPTVLWRLESCGQLPKVAM